MPHEWANPADKPGVEVFRPERLPGSRYNSVQKRVEDSNGDYLALQSGHAGGNGIYSFGNMNRGLIAYGEYRYAGGNTKGLTVFEVFDLKTNLGAAPKLTRSEFGLKRISEMFRASMDSRVPNHRTEVIVVDSRPKLPS